LHPISALAAGFESSEYSIYASGSNPPPALNSGTSYHFWTDTRQMPMTDIESSSLESLRIADPETHAWVSEQVDLLARRPTDAVLDLLVREVIWALSVEPGLGRAVAKGLLDLMARGPGDPPRMLRRLEQFMALVRRAAGTGPTLGRLVATYAAPVFRNDGRLLDRFEKTLAVMLGKGTYTLSAPLEAMDELIAEGDEESAAAYLDLLATVFQQEISYNQSLRLVYLLPKSVRAFHPRRRRFQIDQLHRLASTDLQLVEAFQDGLDRGLGWLDAEALTAFTTAALSKFARGRESGVRFLSLTSKAGQSTCAGLQRAVHLTQVQGRLDRYLNARMGRAPAIKPLSALTGDRDDQTWVCSDGQRIYLPDEIDRHPEAADNAALYKTLVRLEAGYFEFRTFDFDLERAADLYAEMAQWLRDHPAEEHLETICDGERFIQSFVPSALARDLFDLFEQARVAIHLNRHYPGLMAQVLPVIRREAQSMGFFSAGHPLAADFSRLMLAMDGPAAEACRSSAPQVRLADLFRRHIDASSPVEASARLVCLAFDALKPALGCTINQYAPLKFPFGRRIHWHRAAFAFADAERAVRRIKQRLDERNLRVYRADLRNRLVQRQGRLCADDVVELVLSGGQRPAVDLSLLDLDALLDPSTANVSTAADPGIGVARYPEWDHQLRDYLHEHTCVRDLPVPEQGDQGFYTRVLTRYRGLVARMRRAFELLKPERLTLLRQWPEGDAFDYRALIDFAIDRKAGRIPSDRLFVKRLKQERDVAVLLLVDISRSTSNTVPGGQATVLEVAKEALVLFCEALQVVGDDYAVAGFSGTGRHAVDYFTVKMFQEPLTDVVRARISALMPQRSTRMGAAIRHATAVMAGVPSRVRLILLVSDGFPNDLGYKAEYATADTCKAVQEARSRGIHIKAITVNIGSDPRLDDLYGRAHHHVIGDVRELPDRLLRLYGTLTRT
jgi:nitric oxide reductase NorD protein